MEIKHVINLFNNRKTFFNEHPEAYRFLKENFSQKQEVGSSIEIKIVGVDGVEKSTSIKLMESDMPFMDSLSGVLREK